MNALFKIMLVGTLVIPYYLVEAAQMQEVPSKSDTLDYWQEIGGLAFIHDIAKFNEYCGPAIDTITDINQRDKTGNTVLHIAVNFPKPLMLELLLEKRKDLDINRCNSSGFTALEEALNVYIQNSTPDYPDTHIYITEAKNKISLLSSFGAVLDTQKFEHRFAEYAWAGEERNQAIRNLKKEVLQTYQSGRTIAEQHKKEQAAYKLEIADQLQEHIPVRDLNNIVIDYAKMSLLEFIHLQKQQVTDNTVSNNSSKN